MNGIPIPEHQLRIVESTDELQLLVGPTKADVQIDATLAMYRSGFSIGDTIGELAKSVEHILRESRVKASLDWQHCTVVVTKQKKDRRHDGGIKIKVVPFEPGA